MTARIPSVITLLALLVLGMFAAGCNTERFNDPGCASDHQCRGERICATNRCVHPNQLTGEDDAGHTGEDAGGHDDDGFTDDADAVDVVALTRLLGTWEMTMSGTFTEAGGEPQRLEEQPIEIRIVTGEQSDIEILLTDDSEMCGLGARLTADGFEFDQDSCVVEDGDRRVVYAGIAGRGTLERDDFLVFDLQMSGRSSAPDTPTRTAEFDLSFEGARVFEP